MIHSDPLMLRILACVILITPLLGQGVITTAAGGDYVFPDDGVPALKAAIVRRARQPDLKDPRFLIQ